MLKLIMAFGIVVAGSQGSTTISVIAPGTVGTLAAEAGTDGTHVLPCHETFGVWLPGAIEFGDGARPEGGAESQNRPAPGPADSDCALV